MRSSSSIGRRPCSARHSSISRGCSSACTWSGRPSAAAYRPSSSSQSAGQARTEWGATPTAAPRPRSSSSPRRYSAGEAWRNRCEPAPGVCGEEQHDRDPCLLGRVEGRVRLGKAEVVELADRRVTGCTELAVGLGVRSAHDARASGAPPRRACAPARPRSRHPRFALAARAERHGSGRPRIPAASTSPPRGDRDGLRRATHYPCGMSARALSAPRRAAAECADDPAPGARAGVRGAR